MKNRSKQQRGARTDRVSSQIQEILAPLLREVRKNKKAPLATITEVKISKDLSAASVYVTVLSDDQRVIKETIAHLNHQTKTLRFLLAQNIKLRIVPTLRFYFDESTLVGFRIAHLLDKAEKDAAKAEDDESE